MAALSIVFCLLSFWGCLIKVWSYAFYVKLVGRSFEVLKNSLQFIAYKSCLYFVSSSVNGWEFYQWITKVHAQTTILHVEFQFHLSCTFGLIVSNLTIRKARKFSNQTDFVELFVINFLGLAAFFWFNALDDNICVTGCRNCGWIKFCNKICIASNFINNVCAAFLCCSRVVLA